MSKRLFMKCTLYTSLSFEWGYLMAVHPGPELTFLFWEILAYLQYLGAYTDDLHFILLLEIIGRHHRTLNYDSVAPASLHLRLACTVVSSLSYFVFFLILVQYHTEVPNLQRES